MEEMVMVFKNSILQELGGLQGYTFEVDRFLHKILAPGSFTFIPRTVAESNPQYKQLIPYIVLRYRESVFSYLRGNQSTEGRLIKKRSIGVGGHVQPTDRNISNMDGGFYYNAAKREVSEEVEVTTTFTERIVALINDETNDVGRVHFGIVHVWNLEHPLVRSREEKIVDSGFIELKTLAKNTSELETWSQIALAALAEV